MRFRPLLALMLAFCLTFTTLPSSASAALKGREQGNARFGNVVNTGQADACTVLPAGSSGSINADGQFKSLCLQPTEVSVKLPGNRGGRALRRKRVFLPAGLSKSFGANSVLFSGLRGLPLLRWPMLRCSVQFDLQSTLGLICN
jgi:hypothetical protein